MPGTRPEPAVHRTVEIERRQRSLRRRRTSLALGALFLVAGGVAACATITHVGKRAGGSTSTSTDGPTTTTTTTNPKVPRPPASYNVGLTTFHFTDPSRDTPNPGTGALQTGRVLTTEVFYPTVKGSPDAETANAAPASAFGPFPVIVFAHGFNTMPETYWPLLDSWVHAGFVVVAPVFPDENAETVTLYGGPEGAGGNGEDYDETNEPGDIAYVLGAFAMEAARGSGSPLAGVADMKEVALAGQSDGANVVAALAFGSAYEPFWRSMSPAPKAVAVLSGQAIFDGPGNNGSNTYSSGPTSPAVLQVQSIADSCNLGRFAADLYSYIDAGPVHFFETLTKAGHLDPYVGVTPWSTIVENVTTTFFKVELGWRSQGLSLASVEAAGTVPGDSSMTPPDESTFLDEPATQSCTFPPGVSPTIGPPSTTAAATSGS